MSKEKFRRKIRRVTAAAAALALAVSFTFPSGTDMSGISFGNAIVASATTVDSGDFGEGLHWELDDNDTLTISGSGAMTDWSNSSKAPWYYNYRGSIKTVVIGQGVTSIGNWAFYECSSIESISIEGSVTSIGIYAFRDCSSLESISIPDSVNSIGEDAFGFCTSLTSITIPGSVTSIGKAAFMGCSSLTSITIPDSVSSIGVEAFVVCTSLTSINVNEYNQNYCSVDGVLFNKDKNTLIAYPANKSGASYDIPDSVEYIEDGAFSSCISLKSITIPDSVNSIGSFAFNNCTSLKSITIPDSVNSIGETAFGLCTSLTNCTISNNVTSIGGYTFQNCPNLKSIIIPSKVSSIGNFAFGNCPNLNTIFLPDTDTLTIGNDAIPDTAKQIKYTVTANEVTITKMTNVSEGQKVDIPEKISGYPVVYVEEAYRRYVGNHTCAGGTATCTAKAVCGLCGHEYGSALAHDHSGEWHMNDDEHWKICADENCDEILDKAEHTFDEGVITKEATEYEEGVKTYTCQLCGYQTTEPVSKLDHTHKESTDLMSDVNGHWHYCTECSEKLDYEAHTSDGGRVTKQATSYCEGEITYSCTVCGRVLKTEIIPMTVDPVVMGAFANSYIYSYDSDMNKITMNRTRKQGTITVDLGKEYAGKSFVLYEGRKSTNVKVTEGTLDKNGKFMLEVENGNNYTLVVLD